jgi:serine/threonine-protein kinase HipA
MVRQKKTQHRDALEVWIGDQQVGRLAQSHSGEIWFEYDDLWVKSGFALSPTNLFRLRVGAFKASEDNPFGGLHGVFNDALPDGWGLLLMDRTLKQQLDWDSYQINPLDRLAYIGNRAMGALEFREPMDCIGAMKTPVLADLAKEAHSIQAGNQGEIIQSLRLHGGSPGGARPKVTIAIKRGRTQCISGFDRIPDDFDHWMVKFRTRDTDPDCMGQIEYAYAQMAGAAKVVMPPTQLISLMIDGKNEHFFATQRFDRIGNQKVHTISLAGMMELTHRAPSMDYTDVLKAILFATKDMKELKKGFRLMVFNVLAHNKDDHIKNFSFIYDQQTWKLAPAYDLTFSTGLGNQHMTALGGEGAPKLESIQRVAKQLSIPNWKTIVQEVFNAVSDWPQFAKAVNIPNTIIREYQEAMQSSPSYRELKATN